MAQDANKVYEGVNLIIQTYFCDVSLHETHFIELLSSEPPLVRHKHPPRLRRKPLKSERSSKTSYTALNIVNC